MVRIAACFALVACLGCSTPQEASSGPVPPGPIQQAETEWIGRAPDRGHDPPLGGAIGGYPFVPSGAIALATDTPGVKRVLIADMPLACDRVSPEIRDGAREIVLLMPWKPGDEIDLREQPATVSIYKFSQWVEQPSTAGHAGFVGGSMSIGGSATLQVHVERDTDYVEGVIGVRVCS